MSSNNNQNQILKENKSCKCVKQEELNKELTANKNNLKKYFEDWEETFKATCIKNGKYDSFADYLENHEDFKKPAFITLRQSDFDVNPISKLMLKKNLGGTLRIVTSSYFELGENITFDFNEAHNFIPTNEQTTESVKWKNYPQKFIYPVRQNNGSYDLGFFAGITVEADKVVINMNKKKIKMSEKFYFMQRFFSLIELASSPFIPTQGPGDFGKNVRYGENVIIRLGRFGLSSHNGIHGNNNKHLYLNNLEIKDFEIAGVALNDVDNFLFSESVMGQNFQNVPVKGNVAFLVFAVRSLKRMVNMNMLQWKPLYQEGKKILDRIYFNYRTGRDIEFPLGNDSGLADGLNYGVVINSRGVAINGFTACCSSEKSNGILSENVYIDNIKIKDIVALPEEVVSIAKEGKPVVMGFGSILRLGELTDLSSTDGTVEKSPFSNFVFSLADKLRFFPNDTIFFAPTNLYSYEWIIDWYLGKTVEKNIFRLIEMNNTELYCNADTMNHVQKGTMGFRIQGVNKGLFKQIVISNIQNLGDYGSSQIGDYNKSHPKATLPNYGGNICRGFAISNAENVNIKNCTVSRILSKTGSAYGIDIIDKDYQKIYIENNKIDQVITLSNEIRKGNRYPESRYITI